MSAAGMPAHLQEQLLDALMFYLSMEVRGKIIREVPAAYNAYCGREIAIVSVMRADVRDD